jgi:hypothetical protein
LPQAEFESCPKLLKADTLAVFYRLLNELLPSASDSVSSGQLITSPFEVNPMSFFSSVRNRHPEDDIPKPPPRPPAKEPEPDVPEPDDELRDLVNPVKA